MGLLFDHLIMHAAQGRHQPDLLGAILLSSVYEVSNVVPLFQDWGREADRRIPRRPPCNPTWAEWIFEDEEVREQIGIFVHLVSPGEAGVALRDLASQGASFDGCTEFYKCHPVSKVLTEKRFGAPDVRGRLFTSSHYLILGMRDDSSSIEHHLVAGPQKPWFGLPQAPINLDPSGTNAWRYCWPAFMAFALLHCNNVRAETIPAPVQKPRHARQGLPPRASYHVLRLELPNEVRPRGVADTEGEEAHFRLHLCRGHFKNLQHERYKNKGWHWWPAHWRGDPALGTVDKSYELVWEEGGQ